MQTMAGGRRPGMGEEPSSQVEPTDRVIGGLYGDQPMTVHKEGVELLVLSPIEVADGREAAFRDLFPEATDNRFDPRRG